MLTRYVYPKTFNDVLYFDKWFKSLLSNDNWYSVVKTTEDDKNIYYGMGVPGFTKEELSIYVEGDFLHVDGKVEKTNENDSFKRAFMESIHLPNYSNKRKLTAKLENGILTVTVPKLPEIAVSGKIKVEIT